MDIASLQRLLDKLIETRYKAEEILTGEPQNVTTLPPITTPNYGQQGNREYRLELHINFHYFKNWEQQRKIFSISEIRCKILY